MAVMFEAWVTRKAYGDTATQRSAIVQGAGSFLLINKINRSNGGLQPGRRYETDHVDELTFEVAKRYANLNGSRIEVAQGSFPVPRGSKDASWIRSSNS